MSIYKELSFSNDVETIKGVQFSIMSPEEIMSKSVCEIVSTDTYSGNEPIIGGLFDSRMGVIENDKICKTCRQKNTFCPGHFGHIQLARPVFYIQFFDMIRKVLKCVCFRCSKLLIDPKSPFVTRMMSKKFSRQKRFEMVYKCCSKIKRCGGDNPQGCGAKLPNKLSKENIGKIIMEWKEDVSTVVKQTFTPEDVLIILKRISEEDGNILGFPRNVNRPEHLICTVFPVPPPSVRPSVRNDTGQRCEDDLTHKLCDIIKTNTTLKTKLANGVSSEQIDYWKILLQFHVATFVDNQIPGIPPAKQRTGRPLRSLTERLKSKEGRIRGNLMGKRVDFSARSVITPDPNIDIDELGVPLKMAMNLTFPEVVNKYNIQEMYKLVRNGADRYPGAKYIRTSNGASGYRTIRLKHFDENAITLKYGDIIDRHLRNGDMVLFNRQPSLHKMSMMAHRVRVMPYETFRLNVCCTPSYNADYDGDEMNMHVPQSLQTENELRILASVPTQIISPRDSSPIISVVQDIVVGLYRISKENSYVNNKQFFNIMAGNSKFTGSYQNPVLKYNGAKIWHGRQLLSSVINPLINLSGGKGVVIEDGVIKSGILDKKFYQEMSYGLIQTVHNDLGMNECSALFDNTQRLICDWLVYNGFSVGISDLMINKSTSTKLKDEIKSLKVDVYKQIDDIHMGNFKNHTIMTNNDHFEALVNQRLDSATKTINNIGTENIKDDQNRMMNMINSKSKGNPINVSQMMGCVGQQSVEGKRIQYGFDSRTLPHFTRYDDGPEARGFVENSFIKGLTAQEFFFHAMGGREGLIDTAVKSVTAETELLVLQEGRAMSVRIGDWIDGHIRRRPKEVQHFPEDRNMEFLKLDAEVFIPTTDPHGKVSWEELTAVTRHDPGERIYKVTTDSGRELTVAESESLLIWNPQTREFRKRMTNLVRVGDSVPVTEYLPEAPVTRERVDMRKYFSPSEYIYGSQFHKALGMMKEAQGSDHSIPRGWWKENNNSSFVLPYTKKASLARVSSGRSAVENIQEGFVYPYGARREVSAIPEMFELSRTNGRFIGLYLGEGCCDAESGKVMILKNDEKVLAFCREWFDQHGMKHKTYTRRTEEAGKDARGASTTLQGYSTLMALFLDKLVGKGSENKNLPDVAFIAQEEFVLGLIEGYLTGEGTVDTESNAISVSSASKSMLEGFALLMNRLGVFGRIDTYQATSENSRTKNIEPTHRLMINGVHGSRLAKKIDLFIDQKQALLKQIIGKSEYCRYEIENNMIVDPIVDIQVVSTENHPKLYDVTVPKTLNFNARNGIGCNDTSETGYLQRKLIKAMEDAKVNFDMTVRSAGGNIIQYQYGDDSVDAIKLEKHHLDYLAFDITLGTMEDQYLLTDSDNLRAILSDETIKEFYGTSNWRREMTDYFHQVLKDREFIITQIYKDKPEITVIHPVAAYRLVKSTKRMFDLDNVVLPSDLNPMYVLKRMEELYTRCTPNPKFSCTKLMEIVIRHYFSPKKMVVHHKFTQAAFDYLVENFAHKYQEALVNPSEMVGVVAAQSIGEPSTQLTLNSVEYNTEIMVSEKGKIREYRIGDWIERRIAKGDKSLYSYIERGDQTYTPISEEEDVKILSADEDGNVFWDSVEAVTKHLPINEDGTNTLIRVTSLSGNVSTVTKGESVITRQNNKLMKSCGADLKEGDYLIKCKVVPVPKECQLNMWDISEQVPKSEFVYMSEVDKALNIKAQHNARGSRHWWKQNIGVNFELPYTRSDGFVEAFLGIGGKSGRRTQLDNRPGCVYPKGGIGQSCHFPEVLTLDAETGFVMGAYLSEGCTTEYDVLISNDDDVFMDRIKAWLDRYEIHYHFEEGEKPKGYSRTIRIDSLVMARLFQSAFSREVVEDGPDPLTENADGVVHQLVYQTHQDDKNSKGTAKASSRTKHLPGWLLGAPDECLKGLIDSYFSGDGCVEENTGSISAASLSRSLLEGVGMILQKFGVISSVRESPSEYKNAIEGGFQTTMLYELNVNTHNSVLFARQFKMCIDYKQILLNGIAERTTTKDDMFGIVPDVVTSQGTAALSIAEVEEKLRSCRNVKDRKVYEDILKENVFYDRVVKVEEVRSRHTHVYDMTTRISRNFSTKLSICRDTFHLSGVASASKAVRGVPRIKELLSVSKNIKAPSLTVYLRPEYRESYEMAQRAMNSVQMTHIKDMVISSRIYYEPDPRRSDVKHDTGFMQAYSRFQEIDPTCADITSPWVLRFELDHAKMLEFGLDANDVHLALTMYCDDKVHCVFSDDNSENMVFRIRLTGTGITDVVTELKGLEFNIMHKMIISGVSKVKKASINKKKSKILSKDGMFKVYEDFEEHVLETDGTNLVDVLGNKFVDNRRTISNDIMEIYETLGVEAARQALYNEIKDILNDSTSVNHRHIALLVDTMTCKGYLLSIDRHGINRSDIGPLAKCSFEETSDILIKAGIFGETDKITGVSANIILGQIAQCGTGDSKISMDTDAISKLQVSDEEEQEDDYDGLCLDIEDCMIDFDLNMGTASGPVEKHTMDELVVY